MKVRTTFYATLLFLLFACGGGSNEKTAETEEFVEEIAAMDSVSSVIENTIKDIDQSADELDKALEDL